MELILHIAIDDKFIDMAYQIFEKVYPNNNKFIIVTNNNSFKYIKNTPVTTIAPKDFLSSIFIKSLEQYEFVVLHGLDFCKKLLLLKAPSTIKFVWIGWGADYYGNYIQIPLLMDKTKEIEKELKKKQFSIKRSVKYLVKKIILPKYRDIKAVNRINYFAPVLENEYYMMKTSLPNFKSKFVDWNYGTLEDNLIKLFENKYINGDNILVGNSATLTNNHIEILEKLKDFKLDEKKIILPLSYGDKEYAKIVINQAESLLGKNRLEVLTDFIPIEDYLKIISSCSITIMNHLRQQAVGNVIIMLYLGAKVFLHPSNPVYKYFKNKNLIIYSIDDLNTQEINERLNKQQILHNRNTLKKLWGRETAYIKTLNLIDKLRND